VSKSSGLFLALVLVLGVSHARAEQVRTVKKLPGYQCMVLAKQWNGEGPMPLPVYVYAGPQANAAQIGVAGGSVIVPDPVRPTDGRTQMIFADGRTVWIAIDAIAPWHAVSNPSARCSPVLLSNGRYGFQTNH